MMTSKTCRVCKQAKDKSEFYNSGHVTLAGRMIKDTLCKPCKRSYNKKRNNKIKAWVNNYKSSRGCEKCGYSFDTHSSFKTSALEFHHAQDNKKFAIGNAQELGYSIESIQEEINKCVLLCSRCHAELHSNERHNL